MARHHSPRKTKKDRVDASDPELLKHIQALGLPSVEGYTIWCAEHGFSRRTDKDWRLRMKETAYANRAVAEARLRRKKEELRKPDAVIERIFRGELHEGDVTQPHLKAICRACEPGRESRETRLAFHALLRHCSGCSDLVSGEPAIAGFGRQAGNTYVEGLLALARRFPGWIRQVGDWKPQTHNARRQFSSLARHLVAEWPVPAFLDSVWFLGSGAEALQQQGWFLHVGRGENIRTADLPLAYTKRMAHFFMQAPADLTVEAALRWGQVLGLGGEERLAAAILGTRLGSEFRENEFWITVLRFFLAHPMLDLAQVGPIVDYIHQQRFVPQDGPLVPEAERRGPAQPHFAMKGRTPESLLRQVEAWHRTLAKTEQPKAEWRPSGITAFEFLEGGERSDNLKIWTITELLSSKALAAEGRKLKHCVASYAHSCASGACSIWTLEVETTDGRAKLLTVQVQNAARVICQVRGKCNMLPGEKHLGLLRRWAAQAGLSLGKHL